MTNISTAIFFALLSSFLFYKLKIPGGVMIGAIFGMSLHNILFDTITIPAMVKTIAQIIAGAFVGSSMGKKDIEELPQLIKPIMLIMGNLVLLNIILGFLIWWSGPMDLKTALFCAVPGGMSDIPIIASDMGADTSIVSIMQFLRLLVGITFFPTFILTFLSNEDTGLEKKMLDEEEGKANTSGYLEARCDVESIISSLYILALAAFFAISAKFLSLPINTLVVSMLTVLCYKMLGKEAQLPSWMKRIAQALSGIYIGSSVSSKAIQELRYLALPGIILIAGYLLNCVITGNLLHRIFGFSYREAFLTATPAGASDMALISSDLGVYSNKLIKLQILRMIIVISIFPYIIEFIYRIVDLR